MEKQFLRYLLPLLVLVIAASLLALQFKKGQTPRYKTGRIERGDIMASISATGSINPLISVLVGTQVSGMVKDLYVDFNSRVRKGQIIARIDPEILQVQLAQAQANVEVAKGSLRDAEAEVDASSANVENARANLEKAKVEVGDAKRNWQRVEELFQKGLVPESEQDAAFTRLGSVQAQLKANRAQLASAEFQWKAAQAKEILASGQLKQAQASLQMAQVNLKHTVISSPIDGVVISRNVDVGQTVAASLQAPTLFTIAQDLTKMQVIANVDEADVGRVREGQEATFTVDSFPDRVFLGRISQIRNAPVMVQNVVTYDTIIEVENPELLLKPGMTANITIRVQEKRNVLKLPNAAIRFRPPDSGSVGSRANETARKGGTQEEGNRSGGKGWTRVWTLSPDGRLAPVWVRLGLSDGTFTEILEGQAREGQELVVESLSKASEAPRLGFPGMMRGIR